SPAQPSMPARLIQPFIIDAPHRVLLKTKFGADAHAPAPNWYFGSLFDRLAGHDAQGVPRDDDFLVRGDDADLDLAVVGGDDAFLAVALDVLDGIELGAHELEALHDLLAQLRAVFADAGRENDHVHAVHHGGIAADVLADAMDEHIAGDDGALVAAVRGGVDVAHVAAQAADAKQTALFVAHVEH